MFIYEKDGTLDIMFQKGQFPAESENSVDILLKKVDGAVKILIDGKTIDTNGALSVSPTSANITGGGESVVLTVSNATGTIKCAKKATGSTATGLSRVISDNKITVTASDSATAGTWIYTVSDDNDSVDVTFTVAAKEG